MKHSNSSAIKAIDELTLRFTLARFALDGPVLPLVTETLTLAERVRRSLLAKCKYLALRHQPGLADAEIWQLCPAFSGKDADGRPQLGHRHAFFLPTDEDGDGALDHITVIADQGFTSLECQALNRLRRVELRAGNPMSLLLLGLGRTDQFRAPLLAESHVWVSGTPFVVTRYPKRRGRKRDQPADLASPQTFARRVLLQELDRLRERRPGLAAVADAAIMDSIGPLRRFRAVQFKRFRNKAGDDGGRRPACGFRITFAAPVRGPLCLGHSNHFGLGLFLPEPQMDEAAAAIDCPF